MGTDNEVSESENDKAPVTTVWSISALNSQKVTISVNDYPAPDIGKAVTMFALEFPGYMIYAISGNKTLNGRYINFATETEEF